MAGKRPDQYQIAPSENRAMDYKTDPEVEHGQDKDMRTQEISDKQRLAQSQKKAEGQPFPPDVPAPSAEAKRGEKLPEDQPGAADVETDEENPMV